jgi:hypothetical protein
VRRLLLALVVVLLGIGGIAVACGLENQGSSPGTSEKVTSSSHYCGDTNYDGRETTPCLTGDDLKRIFGAEYQPTTATSASGIFEYRYVGSQGTIRFAIASGPWATSMWQGDATSYSHMDGWKLTGDITTTQGARLTSATEVHAYRDMNNRQWWFKIMTDDTETDPATTSQRLQQATTLAFSRFPTS